MKDRSDWTGFRACGGKLRVLPRKRLRGLMLSLMCCYSMSSTAQPAAQVVQPREEMAEPPAASRAMLEFLSEFSELDDAEFEMLSAYAERDAHQEPQDSADE